MLLSTLVTASIMLGSNSAFAEELAEFDLDTMVVTATRTLKDLQEVPASVCNYSKRNRAT